MSTGPGSLSAAEVTQFGEQGYLGPFPGFSREQAAQYRQAIYQRILPPFGPDAHRQAARRPHQSRTLFELCSTPTIVDKVCSLLGPDVVLWTSNLFEKPPDEPELYPWHRDAYYWDLEPMVTVSAWLALTRADLENGCMEVIPGSHAKQIPATDDTDPDSSRRFDGLTADPDYFDESERVPLILEAGEFFLFSENILHYSGRNTTRESRLGLSVRYTVPTVAVRENDTCILLRGQDRHALNRYVDPPLEDPDIRWRRE